MEGKFSFNKGWQNLRMKDQPKVRDEIKQVLRIKTDAAFMQRRRGGIEHRITEVEAIESVFIRYGVPPGEIWGNV